MILPFEAETTMEHDPSTGLWSGDAWSSDGSSSDGSSGDRSNGDGSSGERRVEPLEFCHLDTTLSGDQPVPESAVQSELERQTIERDERAAELESARYKGYAQGREAAAEDFERRLAAEREKIAASCEAFLQQRSEYFAGLEVETVQLSLAIARRILYREARLDPLLLHGAVTDVLRQLKDERSITLKVPPGEVEGWREIVRGTVAIEIVADAGLTASQCVLETGVGHLVLGLQSQLDEVEGRFAELWGQEAQR